ncbi:MAG: hypothetical protein EP329_06540 [Deltaproteobacteria bacterium]|nr:MAG: hypothetical protein EP329_06540 [Deltaproteobacteria bacterium]
MRIIPLALALPLLLPLTACDSSGGGTSAGACQLVGEPFSLPYARDFDVAALGDAYVVALSTDDALVAYRIDATGIGDPAVVGIARGEVHLASLPGEVLAQSFPFDWQLSGPRLARYDGAIWTVDNGAALADAELATRGANLAVSADRVTVGWVSGVTSAAGYTADWSGGAFGTPEPALSDVTDISGYTVHLAYDAAGALHMGVIGTVGGEVGLVHAVRDASGAWGAAQLVGPTPGAFQNIVVTGLAADPTGGVWLAEVHPEDFFEDTKGGLTVWRDDGAGATVVGKIVDDRLVAEGLALAALADGRAVASASWGANNLDAAQSQDDVRLYLCAHTGGCRRALTLDGRRGVFYEATHLATSGTSGLAVWGWTVKGEDGATGVTAARFTCAP